jgi:hypothetical protein
MGFSFSSTGDSAREFVLVNGPADLIDRMCALSGTQSRLSQVMREWNIGLRVKKLLGWYFCATLFLNGMSSSMCQVHFASSWGLCFT